jgi:hypothetical protein
MRRPRWPATVPGTLLAYGLPLGPMSVQTLEERNVSAHQLSVKFSRHSRSSRVRLRHVPHR